VPEDFLRYIDPTTTPAVPLGDSERGYYCEANDPIDHRADWRALRARDNGSPRRYWCEEHLPRIPGDPAAGTLPPDPRLALVRRAEEHPDMPRNCACETCKLARFEPSKLGRVFVEQYHYKPYWRMRRVRNDPMPYYLGVELETDNFTFARATNKQARIVPSAVAVEVASSMALPKSLWVAKRDSSVSGPEFASHPATLTWWRKNRKALAEMFTMLLHAGYRSHDTDRCGMHVNISRNAFDSPEHLYRFLTLIHITPRWSLKMSQRTKESASHYAALDLNTREDRLYEARSIFRPGNETHTRYTALNAPWREQRFEFRLPRGTLRIDRFFKNLEWTVAMIEFTRKRRLADVRPPTFEMWVMAHRDEYPDLARFIIERFSV